MPQVLFVTKRYSNIKKNLLHDYKLNEGEMSSGD